MELGVRGPADFARVQHIVLPNHGAEEPDLQGGHGNDSLIVEWRDSVHDHRTETVHNVSNDDYDDFGHSQRPAQ